MSASELVIVGRIGAPHGVDGAVRVHSSTQPPENIEHYRPWLLGDGERFREVSVERLEAYRGGYLARLGGIGDREQAQALKGALIAVPRSALPPLEPGREYYWRDLIGLAVRQVDGTPLGRVTNLLETGAHDVLIVDDGSGERLIPFAEAFVVAVDLPEGCIVVDWQEPV